MTSDFRETYREKSDDELLRLAMKRNSLQKRAKYAFDAEMWSRGFVQSDLADLETASVHAEKRNWLSRLSGVLGIFFRRR